MRFFITGCAGFIGSNLTDRLLAAGHYVVGYDNLSTGQQSFLQDASRSDRFIFVEGDVLHIATLARTMRGCEFVFHLAANADVRFGTQHPRKDLEQNTIATVGVLDAMRQNGVRRIAYASTGSIYGEAQIFPTPENSPIPVQTSLYGASKVSAEAFIQAYCEGFDLQAYIFRFVSILGERYTHGHVFDFYKQLQLHPDYLDILGNGKQRKSYLYVQDCIDAMLLAEDKAKQRVNIFNLGTDEYCEVDDSINWICERLALAPQRRYDGRDRGWIGDNPFIFLDCSAMRSLGWRPKLTIRQAVIRTVDYLQSTPAVLEARS